MLNAMCVRFSTPLRGLCGKIHPSLPSHPWRNSLRIAQLAMLKRIGDPTDGALFFHHERVNPNWSRHFELIAKIGKHLFYR